MTAIFPIPVQAQTFTLAGSGALIGDTSLILQSFTDDNGNLLNMADFGTIGYGTIEPSNGTQEEQISFSGVTQNANGTCTLTGVHNILDTTPFTTTSGHLKTHAGSVSFIITNSSGFYNQIKAYIDGVAIAGAANATTSVQGLVQLPTTAQVNAGTALGSTGAALGVTPDSLLASNYGLNIPTAAEKAYLTALTASMPGVISPYGGRTAPTGWLLCDGTAVSRTTYATLFGVIAPAGTFTVTIASPAVFTKNSHGLVAGDRISFTTTGGLPAGLATATEYYVLSTSLTANTFKVALSPEGTVVNTSGSQSGTHTLYASTWGFGDGANTFNTPKLGGKTLLGMGAGTETLKFESAAVNTGTDLVTIPNYNFPAQGQPVVLTTTGALPTGLSLATTYYIVRASSTTIGFSTTQANADGAVLIDLTGAGSGVTTVTFTNVTSTIVGINGGEETHGISITELAGHTHTLQVGNSTANGLGPYVDGSTSLTGNNSTSNSTGGDIQHNNMMPYATVNYIIKT